MAAAESVVMLFFFIKVKQADPICIFKSTVLCLVRVLIGSRGLVSKTLSNIIYIIQHKHTHTPNTHLAVRLFLNAQIWTLLMASRLQLTVSVTLVDVFLKATESNQLSKGTTHTLHPHTKHTHTEETEIIM